MFKKGQSGNPLGRGLESDTLKELRELCRGEAKTTIKKLIYWRDSRNAKASITACKELLDRGFGKSTQAVELLGEDGKAITPIINIISKSG